MTAPSLTFRSLDLLTARSSGSGAGRRIQIVNGFLAMPEVRGADYVVAARAGRVAYGRVADLLPITLSGYIAAGDSPTWRILTDEWLAVLDEAGQDPGELRAANGYLGLAAGKAATIAARVKSVMPGPILAGVFQRWSVELESVDPYWVVA